MIAGPVINGETRLYGILGDPVHSSLSPAMQNAAFAALEINAVYLPFPVHPEKLAQAVVGLAAGGVAGFNLTVPHKIAIQPLLDEITPEARAVGAVNTVRRDDSRLAGANTDGEGFLQALAEELDWAPQGKRVLLLGAGGAARGIAFSLLGAGLHTLIIANRTAARAEALAADCASHFPRCRVETLPMEGLAHSAPHLLVNATSAGMGDGESPVELARLKIGEAVADIVYSPLETPLLAQAARLGLPACNGLGMLLHQGRLAFEYWTGRTAPLEVMRQALMAGLSARG